MEPMNRNAARSLVALAVLACGNGTPELAPGGLGLPEVMSTETGHGATPMLALWPGGGSVLSWVTSDSGPSALHVRVEEVGGRIVRSHLIDPLGGIEPHGEAPPQVVVGPDSTLYALYTVGKDVGERYPASALRFAGSTDGGRSWSEPVTVNEGPAFGAHSFHAITAGNGTDVYATWLNNDPTEGGVWFRHSPDQGRTWEPARRIVAGPACPCCRTAVAVASTGRIHVAWRGISETSVRDIQVIHSDDQGVSWSAPVSPRADGWVFNGCPHAGPSLRVDAKDQVHIGWWTGATSGPGVWYARSVDGGERWSAQPIDTATGAPVSHVQLAVRHGEIAVAWEGGRGPLPAIFLRHSLDDGVRFSPAEQLSTDGVAATFPVLGLYGDSVLVAWTQVGDSAYRALLEHNREPEGADERMALPRVGEQEIIARRGILDDQPPKEER